MVYWFTYLRFRLILCCRSPYEILSGVQKIVEIEAEEIVAVLLMRFCVMQCGRVKIMKSSTRCRSPYEIRK